jgi:hypothetical protein
MNAWRAGCAENAQVRIGGRSGETGWLKGRYRASLRSYYTGSGKTWIEEHLGWRVKVVRHPPHPRGEWVPHGGLSRVETVWFSWQRLPPGQKAFRGVPAEALGGGADLRVAVSKSSLQ